MQNICHAQIAETALHLKIHDRFEREFFIEVTRLWVRPVSNKRTTIVFESTAPEKAINATLAQ